MDDNDRLDVDLLLHLNAACREWTYNCLVDTIVHDMFAEEIQNKRLNRVFVLFFINDDDM